MFDALTALGARIRASTWAGFLIKGFAFVCGCGVLAAIGGWRPFPASERAPPAMPSFVDADASVATPIVEAGAPAVALPATTTPPTSIAHGRATAEDPVYLNEAGVEDLRRLPGVGVKRAEAILAHRKQIGRFTRVEDLLRVKGVGRGTIKKWRPLVRFEVRAVVPDAGSS